MYLHLFVLSNLVSAYSIKDIPPLSVSPRTVPRPVLTLPALGWRISLSTNLCFYHSYWFNSHGFCWLRILLRPIKSLTWLWFFAELWLFYKCRIFSTVIYRCCYTQRFKLLKSGKECTSQSSPWMFADTETPIRLCRLTIMPSPPVLDVIEAYRK